MTAIQASSRSAIFFLLPHKAPARLWLLPQESNSAQPCCSNPWPWPSARPPVLPMCWGIGWRKPRRLSAANPTPHGQRGFRIADVATSQDMLGFYLCLYLSPLKLFNLKKNWKLFNKSRQGVSRLLLSTAREKMFQALWAMRFLLKQLTFAAVAWKLSQMMFGYVLIKLFTKQAVGQIRPTGQIWPMVHSLQIPVLDQ